MENTSFDISPTVGRFKEEMQKLYGRRLYKITLYGSYARNDFRDESDEDVLVVLNDERVAVLNEKKIIRKTIKKWSEDMSHAISALPISDIDYRQKHSSLLYFIRKEGKEI